MSGDSTVLSLRERVALHMAATGHVSGCLAEWPVLASAFRKLGIVAPLDLRKWRMRRLARQALKEHVL